jgi:N-acetylmuramoyl-L-alanine amidase
VPVDFVPRALAAALGTTIDLRKPSRLVVIGAVRVPRVGASAEMLGPLVRLTLDVAPATPHAITQDGNRLFVRFEADALDATLPAVAAPDLVRALRVDGTSIVVDLGPRFGSFRTSDVPGDRGSVRVIVDLIMQTTAATPPGAPAPAAPATPSSPPPLVDLAPVGGIRTIVVDAGHGGLEDGAHGPGGTLEKNVTLSVARRLKAALEARLGVRVILTRDKDDTVELDQRASLANNNKADVFVSLHANASVRASAAGAEVFYLSLEEYGDQAQRVAKGETEALPVFGGGTRDIEVILWEMAQARYIEESAVLAKEVEAALRERVPMSPRAIQQAPFRVLVGANMPAVLVEMGFITNADQEKQLVSEPFQTSIVQSIVDSIIRFRDKQAARTAAPAAPGPAPAPVRPGGGLRP